METADPPWNSDRFLLPRGRIRGVISVVSTLTLTLVVLTRSSSVAAMGGQN